MRRLALLVLALSALSSTPAQAYPWMIRHGYSSCAACHVDPSGAGLLTPYGHAQQEILLTAHYGKPPEEVDPEGGLFTKLHLPDWLNAGFSIRAAHLGMRAPANFG